MQENLFNKNAKSGSAGLIITKPHQKILSKQQQTFNKLIKRIEKLRSDLVRVHTSLDEKLDFYVKHIHPLEQQLTELNKEIIKLLFSFFNNKKLLSKKERKNLGGVIAGQLDEIFQLKEGEPEDELKEIFKAVQGISYEKAVEQDFNVMKDGMESIFEEFGFEMNLDGLHSKMTPEEMMRKTIEIEEELKQQAHEKEQRQTVRKKTKKELEKEEKAKLIEEARARNISSIYKQLAKILHPDLEQDEKLKLQKEELMKQLTIAYENNDLHTLLKLELTWIQNEENNFDKLTDEKLGIYNEVLKEQIRELEDELVEVYEHPRYQSLRKFSMFPDEMRSINLKHEKELAETDNKHMTLQIEKLKGTEKQALSLVKELIHEFEFKIKFNKGFSKFVNDRDFF